MFAERISNLSKNRLFTKFLPFAILMLGGSYGLKEFASVRYEFRKNKALSSKELAKQGIERKPEGSVTAEAVLEEVLQETTDDWKNVRGPRPWEDNEDFNKLVEDLRAKNKK